MRGSAWIRSGGASPQLEPRGFPRVCGAEIFLLSIIKKLSMCDCPDELMLIDGYDFDCDSSDDDGVELRLTEVVDTRSKNAIKCQKFYHKDRSAQKRRVVINGMKNHGRMPALRTLRRWSINIHTAIDCYEHLKQKDPEKWDKIVLRARVLIANML